MENEDKFKALGKYGIEMSKQPFNSEPDYEEIYEIEELIDDETK